MTPSPLASRRFGEQDQRAFAELSGDTNPMHLSALAARRTQAGAAVVHGVHAVLWALESATNVLTGEPATLDVRFKRFLYVDAEVRVEIAPGSRGPRLTLWSEGLVCATIDVGLGERKDRPADGLEIDPQIATEEPLKLDLSELASAHGSISATVHDATLRLFPALAGRLGTVTVQALARLSTLVGVVCPGLYSIFDAFSVAFDRGEPALRRLAFAVTELDDRFRSLRIAVAASGFTGTVDAFVRHPPIEQPRLTDLAPLVDSREFAGVTALVIGGTRGLGAATARLIVAGGGRAILTYRVGIADAEALVAELGPHRCIARSFDATLPAAAQLARLPWAFDQAYYFATAQIFREQGPAFSPERFAEFCQLYVNGFADLVETCTQNEAVSFFYPSSTAVASRPRKMTEYAMAKAVGELLCADLARANRKASIHVERLPRVLTDQTASVIPTEAADAVTLMLPIVRRMNAGRSVVTA